MSVTALSSAWSYNSTGQGTICTITNTENKPIVINTLTGYFGTGNGHVTATSSGAAVTGRGQPIALILSINTYTSVTENITKVNEVQNNMFPYNQNGLYTIAFSPAAEIAANSTVVVKGTWASQGGTAVLTKPTSAQAGTYPMAVSWSYKSDPDPVIPTQTPMERRLNDINTALEDIVDDCNEILEEKGGTQVDYLYQLPEAIEALGDSGMSSGIAMVDTMQGLGTRYATSPDTGKQVLQAFVKIDDSTVKFDETGKLIADTAQSDWDATDTSKISFIRNKPDIPQPMVGAVPNTESVTGVATTGGAGITNIQVSSPIFINQYATATGTPLRNGDKFIVKYDGTDWKVYGTPASLDTQTVVLADYGIVITGSAAENDVITCTYIYAPGQDGEGGTVIKPHAADANSYLRGDGTWGNVFVPGSISMFFDVETSTLYIRTDGQSAQPVS